MGSLTFIGDIFPGDEIFTKGFGIKSKTSEGNVALWTKNVRDVVGDADYIVGNLESPLVDDTSATDPTFYGKPLFADVLKGSGINILNMANNHILEHGIEGFNQTLDTLHNKQLQTVGTVKHGKPEILSIQMDDTKICMAGFCDERVCNIDNPDCYASLDETKVLDTLERIKALHPDIIIFVFHWGNEYIHLPSLEQRLLAYKLIDHGVSLIVGHHPHVIQPYERYHDGHIIYSLGNFCFDDVQSAHFGVGMIAKVEIERQAIIGLSFSGVLVQDMAYSDELVQAMDKDKFNDYFSQINSQYAGLQQLPDDEYMRIYQKANTRAHSRERILMRLNIIKKAFAFKHRHRAQLFRNIKNYIA